MSGLPPLFQETCPPLDTARYTHNGLGHQRKTNNRLTLQARRGILAARHLRFSHLRFSLRSLYPPKSLTRLTGASFSITMVRNNSRNRGARRCIRTTVDYVILDPEVYLHPKGAKGKRRTEFRCHNRRYAKHAANMMVKAANGISRSGASVVAMRGSCGCEPRLSVRAAEEVKDQSYEG